MVHVTIEMWPGGNKDRAYPLGEILIANNGAQGLFADSTKGSYDATLLKRGTQQVWKRAAVQDFPRRRLGAYDLLYRILHVAVGDRNK